MVSIIIPTYNRAHLISKAIDSIINQTYKNWELLIIDDGSTDETEVVIKSFLEDKRIQYFKIPNSGACAARNKGLENSKGDYITFLDSDDEYLPEKIEKQIYVFKNSKVANLGVVSCGRLDFTNGKISSKWIPKYKGEILDILLSKIKVGVGTPFLMISKEVRDAGIRFDVDMPAGQDYDFVVSILQKFNFDYADDYLVRVNHHNENRVYTNETALKATEKQFNKYQPLIQNKRKVKELFIIRWIDLLFVYGRRNEAIALINKYSSFSSPRFILWKIYITSFKTHKSIISRIFLKLLRIR